LRSPLLFRSLPAPFGGYFCNKRSAVGKKAFIARAQIVQPRFAIWRLDEAILRTPTMTHSSDLTFLAVAWQGIQFSLPEGSLSWALKQLDQWSLLDIPKAMFSIDEVVT
jgi:hypothetical protein